MASLTFPETGPASALACASAPAPLRVEVHVDFICPWCLIGKRQLETAVQRFEAMVPQARVVVEWRSHELLPDTPEAGLDYETFYLRRLGGAEAVALRRLQVREAARQAGVELAFERISRLPNTARAHDLLARAGADGDRARQAALVERLFVAYFQEGQDIGHPDVLEQLGRDCGLPESVLSAPAPAWDALRTRTRRPHGTRGIDGVPFFFIDGSHAIAGAVSADRLLGTMLSLWRPAPQA
jgi:predicted DsbA family dithiol-disulfide isomerase